MMGRFSCVGKEIRGTVATNPRSVERFRPLMPLYYMVLHIARVAGPPAARRLTMALLMAFTLVVGAPASRGWTAAHTSPALPERAQQTTARGDQGDLSLLPELSAGFEGITRAGHWMTVRAVVA